MMTGLWIKRRSVSSVGGVGHLALTIIFAIQIPVAMLTGLKDSVPYLVFLSLWALVASHWAAFEAAIPPAEES